MTAIADSNTPCVLAPATSSASPLAITGLNILPIACVAVALVIVGLIILFALGRRNRRPRDLTVSYKPKSRAGRGIATALIALALVTVGVGGVGASNAFADANDVTVVNDGCALMNFTVARTAAGSDTQVSGIPEQIMAVTITNVADVPIDVTFDTRTTDDSQGLASFVQVTGLCSCSIAPVVQSTLSPNVPGEPVRMAAGQVIVVHVNAAVLSSIDNIMQGTKTQFVLLATAMEVQ